MEMNEEYVESMDIRSPRGTKVTFTGKGGYDHDQEHSKSFLEVGKEYTIEKTVVHNFSTDVYLKEIPTPSDQRPIYFNSVHFIVEKTITIKQEEYDRLVEQDIWVSCLEAAGVDNWDGYDQAIETKEEWENDI